VTPETVDTGTAARAWIDGWYRAWLAKDSDAIAALYSDDAVFRSLPFREPHLGQKGIAAYAQGSFESEEPDRVWFGEPVAGAGRAAVEYWAILLVEGKPWTLAGTSILRFASDGRCEEQRDYWVMEQGRREPPEGWGR